MILNLKRFISLLLVLMLLIGIVGRVYRGTGFKIPIAHVNALTVMEEVTLFLRRIAIMKALLAPCAIFLHLAEIIGCRGAQIAISPGIRKMSAGAYISAKNITQGQIAGDSGKSHP